MTGKGFKRLLGAALLGGSLLAGVQAFAASLVVGDQSFNARTVMEAAGVLADLPYELEWKQFTAGSPVAEALNVGSLDVGLLGDAPPLFLGALGAPIKVIGISQQNREGVAILVRKDSPIRRLEDIRGHSAAIWKGSWSQQLLFTALERAGVSPEQVQLRYLGALDASHALEGGSVDVIATWEPYVTQQELQGARVLATAEELIPAQTFVVATDKAIAAKRELLGDFLRRLRQARDWVLSDPANSERYADTWAELTRADREVARRWFARAAIRVRPVDEAAIAEAQKTVDFFSRIGLIKGYPAASLFDASFNAYLQSPAAQAAR
ncbi:ABC transporter periplasmic aliphatic sulfonate-binding protein [Azotobacter vinelandii CA]|uniref:Putative aliphatic sulfonates-binding protein n=2 Tax=Azotobacter vinelandii TaxID=354 RepID=C1DNU6_AZOVD|nr:ABC transporter substrate-binding protein [Azotobacter vinelandii]ACO79299.1 ABC transporter periplasmic aliphatic sulfonate-binding protein [Azotobacter vinelandii DJ]AGK14735.1 ABC transporter periplasmic aliphatic sulfonate-binding protein [Azotobacter vinelandii CA]AGK21105.1 ABC transporter periplasmic aliphatic sulfonate-binding protein [Azotobacter vinelandii CA6]WKN20261.1 ABC transporter substrate-binding protein [Azotobacter vinelandii]SFY19947.1 NitT/TauT family transport system 